MYKKGKWHFTTQDLLISPHHALYGPIGCYKDVDILAIHDIFEEEEIVTDDAGEEEEEDGYSMFEPQKKKQKAGGKEGGGGEELG